MRAANPPFIAFSLSCLCFEDTNGVEHVGSVFGAPACEWQRRGGRPARCWLPSDHPPTDQRKGPNTIRKIVVAAAIGVSVLLVGVPANALSPGDTVCYRADGSAVVDPPNPRSSSTA